ncbi:MAG TPA: GGDEF domain-containing protein [Streptosporangiaceae bacterium]|nr:GGDEF domain-containing protein [Streptosporangiaceae bacterium]
MWQLPRWVKAYITATVALYIAALGAAATVSTVSARIALLFGALLLCTAATVELTRRAGENTGLIRDVYAVWELPIAILLPPVFALSAPILRFVFLQWRIRSSAPHRRIFSTAMVGLSYGAASLVFHTLTGTGLNAISSPLPHPSVWMLAVALAAAAQWVVNTGVLLPVIRASDPGVRLRDLLLARENLHNDIAELCVAVLVTFGIAISPVTIVFALPFVTLLQRSVRHAQLLAASRVDSKTGLLNAGTWEREASAEVARAVRTRTPLAMVLIDIDHFKAVNDTHGHLAGDDALRAIARTLKIFLREYDLAGRFGGEEFALLLPQTGEADAGGIAERMRLHIAEMPIAVSDETDTETIHLTVSVGVAALGVGWDRTTGSQLTDLLAGADRALYQAKEAGRNQVWLVTETSTVRV